MPRKSRSQQNDLSVTDDQQLLLASTEKALESFEFFCKNCVKIRDKQGIVRPFVLNSSQQKVLGIIRKQEKKGQPVRVIVLKARQMGISTLIEIYLLWRTLRQNNKKTLEMAHEKTQSAPHIYDISRFAIKNLPPWFRACTGLKETYFTKDGVTFNTGSEIAISSSDSNNPGRSLTLNFVHLSEAAFYEDGYRITAPLFSSMPKTADTVVMIESTGNGPAGYFYDVYQRAKSGKNDYAAVFLPWYEHAEYRKGVPDGVAVHCPQELEPLHEQGIIDDEQLYWRQWTIDNDFNGDENVFHIEYPSSEAEAWMSNASNVFSPAAVYARQTEIEHVPYREGMLQLSIQSEFDPTQSLVKFVPIQEGPLHIYVPPQDGRIYVIGADVGSGVANEDGDPSCADVVDVASGEQVAHLHEVEEPQRFAFDLYALGYYYGFCMLAPEITGGHGLAVVNWLKDHGYYMIYKRRVFDSVNNIWTEKLGWNTSRRTKDFLIDGLRAAFLNGEVIINERGTLNEMLSFVEKKLRSGKRELAAISGAKDDRVISLGITVAVRKDAFSNIVPEDQSKKQEKAHPEGNSFGALIQRQRSRFRQTGPSY